MHNLVKTLHSPTYPVTYKIVNYALKQNMTNSLGYYMRMGDLWKKDFSQHTASFGVHPEKLRQIYKAKDARSVCHLITSEKYIRRLNRSLKNRIVNNEQILTSKGIRHVISGAQPERKKKKRKKPSKETVPEEEPFRYRIGRKTKSPTSSDLLAEISKRSREQQNNEEIARSNKVCFDKFLYPVQPSAANLKSKLDVPPITYNIPKQRDPPAKEEVEYEDCEAVMTKSLISEDDPEISSPYNRTTALHKYEFITPEKEDAANRSVAESMDVEKNVRTSYNPQSVFVFNKEPIAEEKSITESVQLTKRSLEMEKPKERITVFETRSVEDYPNKKDYVNNACNQSVDISLDASLDGSVNASLDASRCSKRNIREMRGQYRHPGNSSVNSFEVYSQSADNPQYETGVDQAGFPVSAARMAFDAVQSKSQAIIHSRKPRLLPAKNLDLDDVTQAVESKKDLNYYWTGVENRRRQMTSPHEEPVMAPRGREIIEKPLKNPTSSENKKKKKNLLVDDVLILFNRVKLGTVSSNEEPPTKYSVGLSMRTPNAYDQETKSSRYSRRRHRSDSAHPAFVY